MRRGPGSVWTRCCADMSPASRSSRASSCRRRWMDPAHPFAGRRTARRAGKHVCAGRLSDRRRQSCVLRGDRAASSRAAATASFTWSVRWDPEGPDPRRGRGGGGRAWCSGRVGGVGDRASAGFSPRVLRVLRQFGGRHGRGHGRHSRSDCSALASQALAAEESWRDGMRAALAAVLAFFDAHPALARVCVVQALGGGPVVLARA